MSQLTYNSKSYHLKLNVIHGETVCICRLSSTLEEAIERAKKIGKILGEPGYYKKAKSVHVVSVKEEILFSCGEPNY